MTTTTLSLPQETVPALTFVQSLFKWESVLFALICLADMLTTIYLIHSGAATEANPMLAQFVSHGVLVFCAVKLLSFVPMLCLAAWYRTVNAKFIETALRLGVVAYVTIYVIGVGSQLLH